MKVIKQLSVFVENKTGSINEMARILGANGINMQAFSLAENADFGILRVIVSDADLAVRVLREAHFGVSLTDVVALACPDAPGALAAILDELARSGVFIEYMYAFSGPHKANVVIRPSDIRRCMCLLEKLSQDDETKDIFDSDYEMTYNFH